MENPDKEKTVSLRIFFEALGIIFSVVFFSVIISALDFATNLESKFYDQNFQRRGPLSVEETDIAIVAVDENTADSLKFPFNRKLYAEVIRKLNKLGARLIVFDIQFSSDGLFPESDSIFYAAIEEAKNVVLVGKIDLKYHTGIRDPIAEIKPPTQKVSPPGTPMGIADELVDPDGVTRRYTLFSIDKGRKELYLSLGLKSLGVDRGFGDMVPKMGRTENFQYGNLSIPRLQGNSTLLNYYGPAGTFPTYSFIDVIRGEYDFDDLLSEMSEEEIELLKASGMMEDIFSESPFTDKIVLIGASAADLQDNKFTPFFSNTYNRLTPGVEVHANAIQMFADANYLEATSIWWSWLGAVIVSILMYLIVRSFSQFLGIITLFVIIVAIFSLSLFLFIKQGIWIREMPIMLAAFLGYPTNLIYQFVQSQKEKAMIRGMFSQYVPKKVTDALIGNPDLMVLGGEKRRMSVLFTDVAGFTSVCEKLTPEEVAQLLNDYLSPLTEVILENDGIIDKYEGDLIMAEFGAPLWFEDHATKCCLAALRMQKKLAELRKQWHEEGRPELYSRVGVNSGDMIIGNMGSKQVFDYTVMGDAVNLSSRLEGANKNYGTTILIGQGTYDDVKDIFVTRPLDLILVKGKSEPVDVYELLAENEKELSENKIRSLNYFAEGLALYRARKFIEAKEYFGNALNVEAGDNPSKVYIERCDNFIANPPPEDWACVETLTEK